MHSKHHIIAINIFIYAYILVTCQLCLYVNLFKYLFSIFFWFAQIIGQDLKENPAEDEEEGEGAEAMFSHTPKKLSYILCKLILLGIKHLLEWCGGTEMCLLGVNTSLH